jgi:DNA-binding NarL/FixJ family response regulator
MTRTRVLLADDHALLAEALRKLLEPQFEVVGISADGRSLVRDALLHKPDVILVDIAMPLLNGLDATQQLKETLPHAKIIIVTMDQRAELATEALRRGASGYLLKTSGIAELTHAIHDALRGKTYITRPIAQQMEDSWVRDPRNERRDTLTGRQREVLQLLAEGRTMKEVAGVLGVTPRTVAFHKYTIMENFGLKNNASLFQLAIHEHLVNTP